MTSLGTAFHCGLISLLWGATNPLIKQSTGDITKVSGNNSVQKFINEIKYLALNWKYLSLFLINQIGSVLYIILLQDGDLSLIVPVVNALTFIITGIVGAFIGENVPSFKTFLGIVCILIGITFCMIDRVHSLRTMAKGHQQEQTISP